LDPKKFERQDCCPLFTIWAAVFRTEILGRTAAELRWGRDRSETGREGRPSGVI
jgi:hypothetical protein